jgi:hypothetical protein
MHVHRGHGVLERRQHRGRQVVGPRVDQVQLEVVPGQDPGQLQPDVPDTEDGHRRDDRERLEQDGHLSPAALNAVLERRLVRQLRDERLRGGGAGREQLARPAYGLLLEVSPADRGPGRRGGDDHLGAGVARGVAAHLGDRHQHPRLAGGAQGRHGSQPRGHVVTAVCVEAAARAAVSAQ